MSVNYALKYASQVDERFSLGSLTTGLFSNQFDWIGVETVKVFSRDLAVLNDYDRNGAHPFARYGNPTDLGNAVQEMQITQDKSITYVIDRKTEQDTMGTMEAAATLAENIDNVVIPAMDEYNLAKIIAACPTSGTYSKQSHFVLGAITASNAYSEFLKVQEKLDNDKAPAAGRIAVVSPAYYNYLKLDENFVKRGDLATKIGLNGQVGEIDGVPVIKVPSVYLPTGVDFIITNPIAGIAPVKLQEMKIHDDAPGISGSLIEARFRFDAFMLNKKVDAIGVHMAAATVTITDSNPTVAVGATIALNAIAMPSGTTVTWTSGTTANATMSDNVVTGVSAGTSVITASVGSGGDVKTDTVTVTVVSA